MWSMPMVNSRCKDYHLTQSTQGGLLLQHSILSWCLRFFRYLTSSSTFTLAMPNIISGQCCYGGQGSKNKAILVPTANRSQKRLYFQTNLIKVLLPLAIRTVVIHTGRFYSNNFFRKGTGMPQ